MNHNYQTEFQFFRDEFRRFKEVMTIHNDVRSAAREEYSVSQSEADASSMHKTTKESLSPSSSSQHATPTFTPSSDSFARISSRESRIDALRSNANDEEILPAGREHQPETENVHSLPLEPTIAQRSRKGHRKSRQGCYNCKRRKIKVNIENKAQRTRLIQS